MKELFESLGFFQGFNALFGVGLALLKVNQSNERGNVRDFVV